MNTTTVSTRTKKSRTTIEALEQRIAPAGVFKWNVNSSGSWTSQANWQLVSGDIGVGYPDGSGDEARFTDIISANRSVIIPDGEEITVSRILFDDNNSYTIAATGNGRLVFEGSNAAITASMVNGSAIHAIQAPIELGSDLTIFNTTTNALNIHTTITEDGNFRSITKSGSGLVDFAGTVANTYRGGTTIVDGTLRLAKTAGVSAAGTGGVTVGDGIGGTSSAMLVLGASQQILDTEGVGVYADGEFDLANFNETLNAAVIGAGSNASIQTGTGTLTTKFLQAFGDFGNGVATISGKLNFLADNIIFMGDSGAAVDLNISAVIGGSAGMKIQGEGTLQLSGTAAQTYTGLTNIIGATVLLNTVTSDAGISNNIRISDEGTLRVVNSFEIPDSASVEIIGGRLEFAATDDFTTLTLTGGSVGIEGTSFFSIRTGGSVMVTGGASSPASRIEGSGNFNIQSGLITLDVGDNAGEADLVIDAKMSGSNASSGFSKTGAGKVVLEQNGTFLGGVTVNSGALELNGTQASRITLEGGRVVRGEEFGDAGAAGFTANAGRLDMGKDGMNSTAFLTLGAASTFAAIHGEFNPSLTVAGSVNLGGATLEFSDPEASPFYINNTILLIANDGSDAINGTFAGLAEGAKVVTPNGNFFITYTGGDGNDVELTRELVTPTILPGGKAATYIDKDGDLVTVKITKGVLTSANFALIGSGVGAQLLELSLKDASYSGSNLIFSAVPKKGAGDKRVDVGSLDATVDLGTIVIPGDLGSLNAGDAVTPGLAIKTLTVNSFGFSAPVNSPGSSLTSVIKGGFTAFKVKGDIIGANIQVINTGGNSGALTVGGSILPGTANGISLVYVAGNVAKVSISGDLVGGTATDNLRIIGNAGLIQIGGSILGGTSLNSGGVRVNGNVGTLTVGGDVVAGAGEGSGRILVDGSIGTAKIAGDILGGTAVDSGRVIMGTLVKSLTIGGDLRGGSGAGSGSVDVEGPAKMVKVAGSILGGGAGSGLSAQKFGSVVVGRDVIGTDFGRAVIAATGTPNPTSALEAVAIGSLSVGKNVRDADILAGYNGSVLTPVEADAQIGKIMVKGNWSGSRALAGVDSVDGLFGNADDQRIGNGDAGILSRIASIVIGGTVQGTVEVGDSFGFVAESIGSLKVAGKNVALQPNAKDVVSFGPFSDTFVREI